MLKRILEYFQTFFTKEEKTLEPSTPPFAQGDIVAKYESNNNPAAISTDPNDPGGVSYGLFQFSSKKGTLAGFLKYTKYSVLFAGLTPGTIAFDTQWIALAQEEDFVQEQHTYAERRYLRPILQYARQQGLQVHSTAMKEALFSIAIQHGGWKKILRMHKARVASYKIGKDHLERIESLYMARREYMQSLNSLTPRIKKVLVTRYRRELTDIFLVYHRQDAMVR